ncbi:MAG: molybdopterin-dependent oxidoreductase [Dehalococcoidales bacterium]|nr:molybdopterin-dependent oxidoreductase [Dehalococcoidales bacterium]
MSGPSNEEEIRGYCATCTCLCPTVAHIKDGVFVRVSPDKQHPLANNLCAKGFAAPELVYNKQRLEYPMRRTNPKGDPDPGWEKISWDEALDTIATEMNEIKEKFGPEAVAFTRPGPGGSPFGEMAPWVARLAHAFGSPNNIGTTNLCQWHRDGCSVYTYARPGAMQAAGMAEFERSACILVWGNNIHATRPSLAPLIKRGLEQGAKLIVIDPRRIEIADMADLWLQIRPGTDGALALSMINVMIEENLCDNDFVRDWTTAPFLVKTDSDEFLMVSDLTDDGAATSYVVIDSATKEPEAYVPGTKISGEVVIDGSHTVNGKGGNEIECKTVFRLLREAVSGYQPGDAEILTGIPAETIREAARMFTTSKPACWYSWNGIEQTSNASQTNRAICILYSLTGNYDKPGGNVILPGIRLNPIDGIEFLDLDVDEKRLGFKERPLGPSGRKTAYTTQAYEIYQAILTDEPYPVKGLIGFGGNLITSNVPALVGKEAISKLQLHVQVELFMTPTAELADIVLPAASSWESWHIGRQMDSLAKKGFVQMRPAVAPPQGDSRPDMEVIFQLAKKLGLGDKFWDGNVEAAFDYHLAPLNVTVEQLRKNPGVTEVDVSMRYQKYSREDDNGNFMGFPTPSKRVEIYSATFKENGYEPLPSWNEPPLFKKAGMEERYPLLLTTSKVLEFCHSQHRSLPSLRKRVPNPFLEINPQRAARLGISEGEWVVVETPYGRIKVEAKLTEGIHYDVVCTQNGWWQSCEKLDLPGYDPYDPNGANVTPLYHTENMDTLSGSYLIKGHPCNVIKLPEQD